MPRGGKRTCHAESWLCVLKAGAGRQLWQGRSQSPREALLPCHPPNVFALSRAWAAPSTEALALPRQCQQCGPPEDLLLALPTHPDVDRGMAPAPALVDCLIAFKIMTMSVGWQGQ